MHYYEGIMYNSPPFLSELSPEMFSMCLISVCSLVGTQQQISITRLIMTVCTGPVFLSTNTWSHEIAQGVMVPCLNNYAQ